ncbi:MAG: Crp/Fnr family transcriptional regulator, partial [Syntrophothermus sp.]
AMGKVKLLKHTGLGREVLLDMLRGGEYFGNLAFSGRGSFSETAIAQTDCCILQISSDNFERILNDHPDVAIKVLKAMGQRLDEFQETIKQLSVYSVERRIAATLVRLANKMGEQMQDGTLIQLPLSRQDLAAMTGTTIETVSRVMSHFSEQGWISGGRKWVIVNDLKQLEKMSEEGAVN